MADSKKEFIRGLRSAWEEEMRSANNYRALASRERNPEKRAILERMAEAEERHAQRWASRLKELGVSPGKYRESLSDRMRRMVLMQSDAQSAAKILEAGEEGADRLYARLRDAAPSESDRIALDDAAIEERAHSRALQEFDASASIPQGRLQRILGRERWHVRAGGWIGQAIYGVNDGLGAAFGVVSGVAGATHANSEFVLLSGLATAMASALSMGSGAYLATKSEREVYEAEIERERKEIESNPEEEREEMELFYQLKGFTPEEAHAMTSRLAEQPQQLLKSLAHEELGLSEQTFPSEWPSAISATLSTAVGAAIPVIPFIFASGTTALICSFVVSTLAHFAVGASKVLVTGRSWLKSGLEMTMIGLGEAAVTYLLGLLVSPLIS
ncbi:MAG TPA: VIT1/CCC1 transporter family protein [Bacteroidota bacterium]|nr:VIT1/CCC1 transporter family protein [Bacteroidota bacterium]